MSVRNSIFRTAERAMPPKIATIGFQMPRPWNFIFVMPLACLEVERLDRDLRAQTLAPHDELPVRDPEMHPRHGAVHRIGLDRRLRIALHLERVLRNRGHAPRVQIRLDVELAVLDERVAQPLERGLRVGSRGRARGRQAVSPAAGDALAGGSAVSSGSV